MKRIFTVLLAGLLCAAVFTGCDSTPESDDSSSNTSVNQSKGENSATEASKSDSSFTNRDMDASYDEKTAVKIECNGSEYNINGGGASENGGVLTINKAGTYILSGNIDDGRIVISADKQDKVQLVLNNLSITSKNHSPLLIKSADKVFITLADKTENTLTDSAQYTALADDESNVDGTIFSKADLTINGSGSLDVTGNMKNGIVSKDDLVITGGSITVKAKNNGICGNDCVKIADGNIKISAESDGIKSSEAENADKGYIYIGNGTLNITSGEDAVQAETNLTVENAKIDISTGSGSDGSTKTHSNDKFGRNNFNSTPQQESNSASTKGLKAGGDIVIENATITADTEDDAIHCNNNLTINSGTLKLASGDDGIHADNAVVISGGDINISKSYESIEGANITVSGGKIDVTSSDDGINAGGGADSSSLGGRPGQNNFGENSDTFIKITGGTITVNAEGDGIDSNGNLSVEGGEIYVNGPQNSGNGALDYEGTAVISGGTVVAVGASSMAAGFGDGSSQCAILYNLNSTHSGGTDIKLLDSNGTEIISYTPAKAYQSVVISTPQLKQNESYTLTAESETAQITLSSVTYSNGGGGFGGHGGHGGGRGDGGGFTPPTDAPNGNPPQPPQ